MFEHLLRTPKVHDLVVRLLSDVDAGLYAKSAPLPPVRSLARTYGVSIFTIHRGLNELKKNGFIRPEGRKANYGNGGSLAALKQVKAPTASDDADAVFLLVRHYTDFNKLGSSLVREKFHQHLHENYPDITLKEHQTSSVGNEFQAEQIQKLIGGAVPSTGNITQTCLEVYNDFKLLAPLRREDFKDYLANVEPWVIEACSRDGELLIVPASLTLSYFLYHKRTFSKMGVSPDKLASWDDLLEVLLALKKQKQVSMACAIGQGASLPYLLMHLACQACGCVQPRTVAPAVSWKSDEAGKALAFFHRLVFAEKLVGCVGSDFFIPRLVKGEYPLCLDSGQTAGVLLRSGDAEEIGVLAIPMGPNGLRLTLANVGGCFVNAKASPAASRAAATYIRQWLSWYYEGEGRDVIRSYNKTYHPFLIFKRVREGGLPYAEVPDDWRRAFKDLRECVVLEPAGCDWEKPLIEEALQPLLAEVKAVTVDDLRSYVHARTTSATFWENTSRRR